MIDMKAEEAKWAADRARISVQVDYKYYLWDMTQAYAAAEGSSLREFYLREARRYRSQVQVAAWILSGKWRGM